jgi:hypothetical protein
MVYVMQTVVTQELFSGGVQQIELRTGGKENRDLGAVAL